MRVLAACLLLLGVAPSPDLTPLVPRLEVLRGEDGLRIRVLEEDRPLDFSAEVVHSLFVQAAGRRNNHGEFCGEDAKSEWKEVWPSERAALVGWEAAESVGENGRILRRSASALVRGASGHAREALGKCGLRGEIRPLLDPSSLARGSVLPVRTYVEGMDTAQRVTAVRRSLEAGEARDEAGVELERVEFSTDSGGHGRLTLGDPGVWTLSFVHEHEVEDEGQEIAFTTVASFTFFHEPGSLR